MIFVHRSAFYEFLSFRLIKAFDKDQSYRFQNIEKIVILKWVSNYISFKI